MHARKHLPLIKFMMSMNTASDEGLAWLGTMCHQWRNVLVA